MKKEAWQVHVDAYNSNQSVMRYTGRHGFVYSQMLYWTLKLTCEPKKPNGPNAGLATIEVKKVKPTVSVLGILEFPRSFHLLATEPSRSLPILI
jgi:hypothetical protein